MVDEAVERNPFRNPRTEVVELPQEFTVKGKVPPPPEAEIVIAVVVVEMVTFDPAFKETGLYVPLERDCKSFPALIALGTLI